MEIEQMNVCNRFQLLPVFYCVCVWVWVCVSVYVCAHAIVWVPVCVCVQLACGLVCVCVKIQFGSSQASFDPLFTTCSSNTTSVYPEIRHGRVFTLHHGHANDRPVVHLLCPQPGTRVKSHCPWCVLQKGKTATKPTSRMRYSLRYERPWRYNPITVGL